MRHHPVTASSARVALLFTALATLPIPAVHAEDAAETHWRLFVGDHAEPVVRALDVRDGSVAGTFRIDQTPALTASSSGETVFAVQGEAGKVAVIDTGFALDDHGEHRDIKVEAPSLLAVKLDGKTPAHVVDGGGTIAVFDDGTGEVTRFAEGDLAGSTFTPRKIAAAAPHHGLAAPMGRYFVVSVPDEDAEKPRRGLRVIDGDGKPVGETVACPGVHGQASSGRMFAFGCKDGVVLAEPGAAGEAPTLRHLSTADLGPGNVSTLKGGTAMRFFLGNYGPDAVVIIEPGAENPFRKVDLPARRVDFALDPAKPRNAFILTEDGHLHRLDVLTGKIEASAAVTEPYSIDGHWRDPRPRLAVAGDRLAVTDPRKGLVRLVALDTLKEDRTIAVEGMPYTIVAVGGSGATH